jgi:hypothetical protein
MMLEGERGRPNRVSSTAKATKELNISNFCSSLASDEETVVRNMQGLQQERCYTTR